MADLADQYKRQYDWRDWQSIYDHLPNLEGKTVLDLGCAIGDQSRDFSRMGAFVTGIDLDDRLLSVARDRNIPNTDFAQADFFSLESVLGQEKFDLIWSSFSIAYFTDQSAIFNYWSRYLRDGGCFAFIEMSNLLGHSAVVSKYEDDIKKFYSDAFDAGRYDFMAGEKIRDNLPKNFDVLTDIILDDKELSSDGVLSEDVQNAWAERFSRMGVLQKKLGQDFVKVFLQDLKSKNHVSKCKVHALLCEKRSV